MEENEKNQNVPEWVKICQEMPDALQQTVGQLASDLVQKLCVLNCISARLVNAMYHEAIKVSCDTHGVNLNGVANEL